MTESIVPSGQHWRAAPVGDIRWVEWDGDYIAFHRPSGKTHLLNATSELLLTHILGEPRTIAEIIDALGDPPDGIQEAEYVGDMLVLLDRFEQLGLVERT